MDFSMAIQGAVLFDFVSVSMVVKFSVFFPPKKQKKTLKINNKNFFLPKFCLIFMWVSSTGTFFVFFVFVLLSQNEK